jgi:uncharacterized delta-60 repeat protein
MRKTFFITCALLGALQAGAQSSHLDPAFGNNGIVLQNLDNGQKPFSMKIAVQSDGKVLAVGSSGRDGLIARFLPNGQPDPSFGSGGVTLVPYTTAIGTYSYALTLKSMVVFNNRIIAAGTSSQYAQDTTLLVAFKPDGRVDSAFGTNGIKRYSFSGAYHTESLLDMRKVNDSQFVAAGYAVHPSATSLTNSEMLVAKFDKNGNLVPGFGLGSGYAYIDHNGQSDFGMALTLDNGGNIYVAGSTYFDQNDKSHAITLVSKLKANGTIDNAFGAGGRLAQSFHPSQTSMRYPTDEWYAIAIQDNKLLLGGRAGENGRWDYGLGSAGELVLQRLKLNGTVDSTFAANGLLRTGAASAYPGSRDASIDHMVVLPDNKIVIAGTAGFINTDSSNTYFRLFLSGLNANGSKNNAFGTNGAILLPELPNYPTMHAIECSGLALHNDGSIYQAGIVYDVSENFKLVIAKFKGNNVSNIPGLPEALSGLKVYPSLQHAGGTVTLAFGDRLSDVARVHLADLNGRTLQTYTVPENSRDAVLQLPGNMAAGMYLLRVTNANFSVTQKIVVR